MLHLITALPGYEVDGFSFRCADGLPGCSGHRVNCAGSGGHLHRPADYSMRRGLAFCLVLFFYVAPRVFEHGWFERRIQLGLGNRDDQELDGKNSPAPDNDERRDKHDKN